MSAPTDSSATALAKSEPTPKADLTVAQKKSFLEVASRTDLDKLSPAEQRGVLIAFAERTGLRAELGEVMIYQGRIYVTRAGMIRNAHRQGLFDGLRVRPATALERRSGGYEEDDLVWTCEVWRKSAARSFQGWGKVTRAEVEKARAGEKSKFTPVAKHPIEMARKRAEYDALRLGFPLDEEVGAAILRYIAEAEEQIEADRASRPALYAGVSDPEDTAAGQEIENGAAVGTELPEANQAPPPPGPTDLADRLHLLAEEIETLLIAQDVPEKSRQLWSPVFRGLGSKATLDDLDRIRSNLLAAQRRAAASS